MSTAVNQSAAKAPNVSRSAESEFNDTPSSLAPVWEVVVGYLLIESALWTGSDLRLGLVDGCDRLDRRFNRIPRAIAA